MFSLRKQKLGSLFLGVWILLVPACGNKGGGDAFSIQISPSEVTLAPGESHPFTASVSGTGNNAVTWKVEESAGGSIDTQGVYQAPSTTGIFHVVATSVADPTQSATAVVTIRLPAGAVDPSFGTSGKVVTPMGSGSDTVEGMVIQPDGKMVIVGSSFNGKDSDFIVARYAPSGSPDTTFGKSGVVLIDFGSGDEGHAIALDSENRIVVAGAALNANNSEFAVARLNPDGSLDTTFGFEGKVVTAIGIGTDIAEALVIQEDGKIVVAGDSHNGTDSDFAIVRYGSAGGLDLTFGTAGKMTTSIGADDSVFGMGLQSTGKIVVVGDTYNGTNFDFAMVRYDTSGHLDSSPGSFGTGGIVTSQLGSSTDVIRSMVVKNDKIIVAGFSVTGTRSDFALARYNANGTFDSTFGNNMTVPGTVVTQIGSGSSFAFAMAIQDDEKILIAGRASNGTNADFALVRYGADGSVDSTFGTGGKVTTDFGAGEDIARAVVIGGDGKIWVAGESKVEGNRDLAFARYLDTGVLDPLFGTNGIRKRDFHASSGAIRSLALQSDGKMIAAGDVVDGRDAIFTLIRYRADGSIDPTFGKLGKIETPFNGNAGGAITLQPDGKIVAVGTFFNRNSLIRDNDFAIVRILPDGSADPAFGQGGGFIVSFGPDDFARSVVLQPDGKILVAGSASIDGKIHFALVRLLPNGTLDTTFGPGGQVTTLIGSVGAVARRIALQEDGKILVGGSAAVDGTRNNFAVARYHADGTLDSSFGAGGKVMSGIGRDHNGVANALRIQKDGKIILGGYTIDGSNNDFALERYDPNGVLDPTFGTDGNGQVTTRFSIGDERINDLLLQEDGKIVAVGLLNIAGSDLALARYNIDGTLDLSFSQDGKTTEPIGLDADFANAGIIQSDGKIVVGGGSLINGAVEFALARFWP